jgi:hypothetical protein
MPSRSGRRWTSIACLAICVSGPLAAEDRLQRFDQDPAWYGHNHRSQTPPPRTIRQDFGYSHTSHAGGEAGEMGGFISPAAEPAYYAKAMPTATLDQVLTASGTLAVTGRQFHALIAFFNAGTLNEWRTPNTIALRISGRDDVFYAWVEYATGRWRAGGDEPKGFPVRINPRSGRNEPAGFRGDGAVHRWSLRYDPRANGGSGAVEATIDDQTAICHVQAGHRSDGAAFNRFGLLNVMKSGDSGGEVWLDGVTINGVREEFTRDPGWDQLANRRTYQTANVRPRFDFGYSATRFAQGRGHGELGGLVFRGDCRFPERMACYGDQLAELALDKPLRASGRVSLRRGVTDSTVLIGFYHSQDSMSPNPSQSSTLPASFLGVAVDGPSREGFYFAPVFRGRGAGHITTTDEPAHIYPDGAAHDWALEYAPVSAGKGRIALGFDGKSVHLEIAQDSGWATTRFNRFGIITTWVDGNGQQIYFDDLIYTCRQD